MRSGHRPPTGVAAQASELFCQDILQHRPIQREIRHKLLQLAVVRPLCGLTLELLQPAHLRWHQATVLLATIAERRLPDARLAADLPIAVPSSALRSTNAICASVNLDVFILIPPSSRPTLNWNFPAQGGPGNRRQVTLRWSPTVGQFDGLVKLGPGCCQAANLIMLPTP
jgi:hypothetical protein